MSCNHYKFKHHRDSLKNNPACHYLVLHHAIIIPVFCVCLIHAMGIAAGMRQVVFMQFDIDADTEYIKPENITHTQIQLLNIKIYNHFKQYYLR